MTMQCMDTGECIIYDGYNTPLTSQLETVSQTGVHVQEVQCPDVLESFERHITRIETALGSFYTLQLLLYWLILRRLAGRPHTIIQPEQTIKIL